MSAQTETENQEQVSKKYFNDEVAKRFADRLGDGASPLQRSGIPDLPYNPATGNTYHGISALSLMLQNRTDDRWLTWDEAKMAGLKIKNNEKPTAIQYWPKKREGEEKRRAITTWVYNGEQLLGMPPVPRKPERPDPLDRVLGILESSGAKLVYDREHRGFYSARHDEIHLPNSDKVGRQQFCEDAMHQYFKALGHPSRLDRVDTFGVPGRAGEAREELICGVATMTMCAELGIPVQPGRAVDLVETWRRSMVARPLDFARDMRSADKTVKITLEREHARNAALNRNEGALWRSTPVEFPYGAVKTFLDRKEVLDAIDHSLEKLDRFAHGEKEIFALRESGHTLARKERDSSDDLNLLIKTRGFDRDGNAHDLLISCDVKLNQNGLLESRSEPLLHSARENTAAMHLPRDWNGKLEVRGYRHDNNGELARSDTPEVYGVLAGRENGEPAPVATFDHQRDAVKYAYQVNHQYEYQGKRRGIDVDFDQLKNPDREFSQSSGKTGSTREDVGTEKPSPEPERKQALPEIEPSDRTRTEAVAAMEAVGMLVADKHPIFDGQGHRIDVDGDRPRQGSGWYAARADGIPSITCVNNRNHVRADWSKSRGHRLSENTRRDLTGIAQAKKTTYQKEAEAEREQALAKLYSMIEKTFVKPTEPTPYLEAKKLPLDPGIYQNKGSTCIPIHDLDGKVYSMAYVQANGTKRYAKNCDKEGHMYILGGVGSLKNAKAFLVGEGYSSVATGAIATAGMGTAGIAAFDSGNLQSVMKTLRERYPDTPIIALGDDDRNLELRDPPLRDQGRYDALRAAEAVANVTTVFPVWSEGIPVDKHHTDFDDLRRINTREGGDGRDGFEAVRSQLAPVIERAIEQTRENRQGQEQVKTRGGRSIA